MAKILNDFVHFFDREMSFGLGDATYGGNLCLGMAVTIWCHRLASRSPLYRQHLGQRVPLTSFGMVTWPYWSAQQSFFTSK